MRVGPTANSPLIWNLCGTLVREWLHWTEQKCKLWIRFCKQSSRGCANEYSASKQVVEPVLAGALINNNKIAGRFFRSEINAQHMSFPHK